MPRHVRMIYETSDILNVRRGASFPCFDMAVILCVLNTKAGWINNVGFFCTLVQSYDIYKQTKSNSDHNLQCVQIN